MNNQSTQVILTKFCSLALFVATSFTTLCGQNILWLRRFNSGTNEFGLDIILDRNNQPIIAGHLWDTVTNRMDILLIKYTPNGDTIWTRYYDGGEFEGTYRLALDQYGNIIVAGLSGNDTIEAQCLVVKFSPDGHFIWKRGYRIRDIDVFSDVAVDECNNIILTGFSYTYAGGGDCIGFIRKYDTQGNLIWTKFYDWSAEFYGIIVLSGGDFLVTGADTLYQMLTVQFDSLGDTIWTRRYSFGGGNCRGWGIAIDSFNNIIVAGYIGIGLSFDWGIIKYTLNGDTVWTRRFDFTTGDWATNVTTDHLGNIYVCGVVGVMDTSDYLLAKLTPNGDIIWTRRYDNGYDDKVYGVAVDTNGNPIVTGTSHNGNDYDIVTIKYRATPGVEEHPALNANCLPLKIYPNPAKTVIRVRVPGNYFKPDAQSSMLKIFDVSGKLIREIKIPKLTLNSFQGKVQYDRSQEIKISLKGIKPGIYFLRLGAETKKFLVIK